MIEQLIRPARVLPALLACCCLALSGAAAQDGAAPVTVAVAQEQDIYRLLQLTGTVTSARSARLSVSTSGLVATMHVDAGSRVTAGQELLTLDPELAQLQLQSARAMVEQARNALADARRRLDEARSLAPQRSIAETIVRDLAAEVTGDEAALHAAEADAGYRQGILDRHQLRAPFDGIISAKLTELGEWVEPGKAVFELVAVDDVRLDFPVSEDYLEDVRTNTPLTFTLNADPATRYRGSVAMVVPVTDPGDRTFLLRVSAPNPDERLIPGMSVRATLKLAAGRRGLAVPRDSIIRLPDGRVVVWTVETDADGTVVRENLVDTGLAFDSLVEVRKGLPSGAQIVVRGNEALQNGQRVVLRPE